MFTKISIVLLTIFGISSLHCMELKISKKILNKQKSKSHLDKKLSNEELATTLEHPFIIAVHAAINSEKKDFNKVKFYLRNPYFDPNITGKEGYSALQIFMQAKACQGIELLLEDHRVHFRYEDLYKENSNKIRFFECLDRSTEGSRSIRQKIFARFTLDLVTHENCENIKSFHKHNPLTEAMLNEIIENIKTAIEQSSAKQTETHAKSDKNAVLPELAGNLPDYATNEFIEKKIWFILSSMQNANNI